MEREKALARASLKGSEHHFPYIVIENLYPLYCIISYHIISYNNTIYHLPKNLVTHPHKARYPKIHPRHHPGHFSPSPHIPNPPFPPPPQPSRKKTQPSHQTNWRDQGVLDLCSALLCSALALFCSTSPTTNPKAQSARAQQQSKTEREDQEQGRKDISFGDYRLTYSRARTDTPTGN